MIDDSEDPLADIDLSSALDYMHRNGVARMKLEIAALDYDPASTTRTLTSVALLEPPAAIVENELPSDEGLGGVFVLLEVKRDLPG